MPKLRVQTKKDFLAVTKMLGFKPRLDGMNTYDSKELNVSFKLHDDCITMVDHNDTRSIAGKYMMVGYYHAWHTLQEMLSKRKKANKNEPTKH